VRERERERERREKRRAESERKERGREIEKTRRKNQEDVVRRYLGYINRVRPGTIALGLSLLACEAKLEVSSKKERTKRQEGLANLLCLGTNGRYVCK